MKPQLRAYASPGVPNQFGEINSVYSQFGEDGMLAHLLGNIGVKYRTCEEFGASDGLSGSNTALLWRDQGWRSVQIEPMQDRFESLCIVTTGYDVDVYQAYVTPENVDEWVTLIGPLDVLSIDVDSVDYQIFEAMTERPRVVIIEFNPELSPHIDIGPTDDLIQTSALAIKRLAERKAYSVAGTTLANLILVADEAGDPSDYYDTSWECLFP